MKPTDLRTLVAPAVAALPALAAAQAVEEPRTAPLLWIWILVAVAIAIGFGLILVSRPRARASDRERARRALRGEDPHPQHR